MTKKLNVLHLTYDMRIGGTEQVIMNLVDGMCDQFSISLFCIEEPIGPFGDILREQEVDVFSYNRKPGFDLSLIKAIRTHIIRNNIDILHCHQYTPYSYGVLASLFTRVRVIFTEHGRFYPDTSSWKRTLINPILQYFTETTISISKATKEALIEFESFNRDDIAVVYNGIADHSKSVNNSNEIKEQLGIDEGTVVLGTIARLDPIKNQELMILSFSKVLEVHNNTVLVIVGDGEMMPTLRALVKELQIEDKVIFTGYESIPYGYLNVMDIFLLSSLSEGTSMTLLEAMSFGKPCVVTDAGGNAEIIIDEKNGLVTPNNDMQSFADAIIKLLNNPDEISAMAVIARDMYEQYFSISTMVNQYKKFYQVP